MKGAQLGQMNKPMRLYLRSGRVTPLRGPNVALKVSKYGGRPGLMLYTVAKLPYPFRGTGTQNLKLRTSKALCEGSGGVLSAVFCGYYIVKNEHVCVKKKGSMNAAVLCMSVGG